MDKLLCVSAKEHHSSIKEQLADVFELEFVNPEFISRDNTFLAEATAQARARFKTQAPKVLVVLEGLVFKDRFPSAFLGSEMLAKLEQLDMQEQEASKLTLALYKDADFEEAFQSYQLGEIKQHQGKSEFVSNKNERAFFEALSLFKHFATVEAEISV